MENVEAVVAKSGETCIQISLGRGTDGLLVNVWAQPKVEDFLRGLGTGEQIDLQTIGRYWSAPIKRDEKGKKLPGNETKLYVYDYSAPPPSASGLHFRLDQLGLPLDGHVDDGSIRLGMGKMSNVVNLSFLRLVGISESGGVSFSVRGVYTREGITQLSSQLEAASKQFYREFIKPYRVIISVSTMPIPDGF